MVLIAMQQRRNKSGAIGLRVRPRVRPPSCPPFPDGIFLLQPCKLIRISAGFYSSAELFQNQPASDSRTLTPRSFENLPNMDYEGTLPSQDGSYREKYIDTARSSTHSPPGELVGCSNGVTIADKSSPRNIHGWKVSTQPQHLRTHMLAS